MLFVAAFLATNVTAFWTVSGAWAGSKIEPKADWLPFFVARHTTHQLFRHWCPFQLFDPQRLLLVLAGLRSVAFGLILLGCLANVGVGCQAFSN